MPYNYLLDKKVIIKHYWLLSFKTMLNMKKIKSYANQTQDEQESTPFNDMYGKNNLMNDDPNENMPNIPASLSELKEITSK